VAGACRYDVVQTACAFGCGGGACLEEQPCAGPACPAPRLALLDGYDGAVYASDDEGQTWQRTSFAPIDAPAIVSMARGSDGALVATTSRGLVVRSTDGGVSFQALPAAPWAADAPDGGAASFVRLAARATTLYAASGHSNRGGILYRSADAGESWTVAGTWPVASGMALGLTAAPGGELYVLHPPSVGGQLLRSVDDGMTFAEVGTVGAADAGAVLAVDSFGALHTTQQPEVTFASSADGGASWMTRGAWQSPRGIAALAVAATGMHFAVSVKGDVLRSEDGGDTWLHVGDWGTAATRDIICCSGWISLALL
jgi:photosystem II stability/assembly factor-like uncharacterized protein